MCDRWSINHFLWLAWRYSPTARVAPLTQTVMIGAAHQHHRVVSPCIQEHE